MTDFVYKTKLLWIIKEINSLLVCFFIDCFIDGSSSLSFFFSSFEAGNFILPHLFVVQAIRKLIWWQYCRCRDRKESLTRPSKQIHRLAIAISRNQEWKWKASIAADVDPLLQFLIDRSEKQVFTFLLVSCSSALASVATRSCCIKFLVICQSVRIHWPEMLFNFKVSENCSNNSFGNSTHQTPQRKAFSRISSRFQRIFKREIRRVEWTRADYNESISRR